MKYSIVTTMIAGSLFACSVSAESITVTDCLGTTESSYSVQRDERASLNVLVQDKEGNAIRSATATLSLVTGGNGSTADRKSEVALGTAVFEDVEKGEWKLCLDNPEAKIGRISIIPQEESSIGAVAATGGAALGVGGAIVGLGSLGGGGNSASGADAVVGDSAVETTTAKASGGASGASSNSGMGGRAGLNTKNSSSSPCFIGDEVTVVSPYS